MREGYEEEEMEWRDAPEPAVRDAMADMLDLQHSRGSGGGRGRSGLGQRERSPRSFAMQRKQGNGGKAAAEGGAAKELSSGVAAGLGAMMANRGRRENRRRGRAGAGEAAAAPPLPIEVF